MLRRPALWLIAAGLLAAGCSSGGSSDATRLSTTPSRAAVSSSTLRPPAGTAIVVGRAWQDDVPAGCSIQFTNGQPLPDPRCTPGATNPAVTQATLSSTVCVPGFSSSIRPPSSYTSLLKRRQMSAWRIPGAAWQVEEDHLIPLALGGAPSDSRNLWPQPGGIPNKKDALEQRLYRLVCAGKVPLAEAQQAIAGDWPSAYRRWVGPLS